MNSRERVLSVLSHRIPDRVPVYEALIDKPTVEYVTGIKGMNSAQLSPRDSVELHRKLGLDAVIAGLKFWRPAEMRGKKLDIKKVPEPDQKDIEYYLERCRMIAVFAHEEGLAAAAYNHGCFDVAYESLGFENFMYLLHDDIGYIEEVIGTLFEYHLKVTKMAVQTGVDFFVIGDDIAFKTGLFINHEMFLKLWYEREKKLIGTALDAGLPVEFHTDGKLKDVLSWLIQMGVSAVNPVEPYSNDIRELKKEYGDRIALRGNVDIAGALAFGTADEVYAETSALLYDLKPGGNYICSTSHSVSDAVIPENYLSLVRAVHENGWYDR